MFGFKQVCEVPDSGTALQAIVERARQFYEHDYDLVQLLGAALRYHTLLHSLPSIIASVSHAARNAEPQEAFTAWVNLEE